MTKMMHAKKQQDQYKTARHLVLAEEKTFNIKYLLL